MNFSYVSDHELITKNKQICKNIVEKRHIYQILVQFVGLDQLRAKRIVWRRRIEFENYLQAFGGPAEWVPMKLFEKIALRDDGVWDIPYPYITISVPPANEAPEIPALATCS